jgi:WD40 repeat protein
VRFPLVRPWQAIGRWLFGPDIFIAYARADGRSYAQKLAQALGGPKFGFSCSLDLRHAVAGNEIPFVLRVSLRRSSMMVVVATRGSARSRFVREEVDIFRSLNRPLAFAVLNDPNPATSWRPVDAANLVEVDSASEPAKEPSEGALAEIAEKATFTKQSVRLRYASVGALALILLAVSAALYSAHSAKVNVETASAARERALASAQESMHRYRTGLIAARALDATRESPQAGALVAAEALHMGTEAVSGWVTPALQSAQDALAQLTGSGLSGHGEVVDTVAFGADGYFVSRDKAGTTLLWKAQTSRGGAVPLARLAEKNNGFALTPDGTRIVWRDAKGTAHSTSIADGVDIPIATQWPEGRLILSSGGGSHMSLGESCAEVVSLGPPRSVRSRFCDPRIPRRETWGAWSLGAFQPDQRHFLVAAGEVLWQWDAREPGSQPRRLGPLPTGVRSLAVSPTSGDIAAGGEDTILRWDHTGRPLAPLSLAGQVTHLEFSRDGERLAAGSSSGWARLWSRSSALPSDFQHGGKISALGFSPGGRWLATGGLDGRVLLWDVRGPGAEVDPSYVLAGHEGGGGVHSLAFSQDVGWLVSAGDERMPRLWDLNRLDVRRRIARANVISGLRSLTASGDRKVLVAGSMTEEPRLWHSDRIEKGPTILTGGSDARRFAISQNGDLIVGARFAQRPLIWALEHLDKGPTELPVVDETNPSQIAVTRDGSRVAASGSNGKLIVRLLRPGTVDTSLSTAEGVATGLGFSEDGKQLYAATNTGKVLRWMLRPDGSAGAPDELLLNDAPLTRLATSLGRMAVTDDRGRAFLWGAGNRLPSPAKLQRSIRTMTWSDDASKIALGDAGGALVVWDIQGNSAVHLEGNTGAVEEAQFSPDGTVLAAIFSKAAELRESNLAEPVRIWDLRAPSGGFVVLRSDRAPSLGTEGSIGADATGLVFGPNGEWLAAANTDGFLNIWTLSPRQLVKEICGAVGRSLRADEVARFLEGAKPRACPTRVDQAVRVYPMQGSVKGVAGVP